MPEIQSADVGRKLQERYNLLGAPPTPFLAGDVSPVVIVDDLTGIDTLEQAFERRMVVQATRSGGIGNRAQLRLINPAGSGVLVAIGSVGFDTSVTVTVRISEPITQGAFAVATPGFATDGRVVGRGAAGVGNGITAGTGSGQLFLQITAAELFATAFFPLAYLLVPGQMVECTQQVTDLTLSATFFWTERNV